MSLQWLHHYQSLDETDPPSDPIRQYPRHNCHAQRRHGQREYTVCDAGEHIDVGQDMQNNPDDDDVRQVDAERQVAQLGHDGAAGRRRLPVESDAHDECGYCEGRHHGREFQLAGRHVIIVIEELP